MAEHLLPAIKDLPDFMTKGLAEIGRMDRETKRLAMELSADQKSALNDVIGALKSDEQLRNLDYEKLGAQWQSIKRRRVDLNTNVDAQAKKAQTVYDGIDETISSLDSKINVLSKLLDSASGARKPKDKKTDKVKSKAKGDSSNDLVAQKGRFQQTSEEFVDPNEPIYCLCRRVAFGTMISCENEDCGEWYHYECVGIPQHVQVENLDGWICPKCSKSGK